MATMDCLMCLAHMYELNAKKCVNKGKKDTWEAKKIEILTQVIQLDDDGRKLKLCRPHYLDFRNKQLEMERSAKEIQETNPLAGVEDKCPI